MENEELKLAAKVLIDLVKQELRESKPPIPNKLDPKSEELLTNLYSRVWCEACYDPLNESVEKFCQELLPWIKELNQIWKFRT